MTVRENKITNPIPGELGRKPVVPSTKARFAEEIRKIESIPKPDPTNEQIAALLENMNSEKVFSYAGNIYLLMGEHVYDISTIAPLRKESAQIILFDMAARLSVEEKVEKTLEVPDFILESPEEIPVITMKQAEQIVENIQNQSIPAVQNIEIVPATGEDIDILSEAPAFTKLLGDYPKTDLEKRLESSDDPTMDR